MIARVRTAQAIGFASMPTIPIPRKARRRSNPAYLAGTPQRN
jgi:hypothetical protein